MKLRYKIVSYSSQDPLYPAYNLITQQNHWQSARFCQYPQEITIMFFEPVKIQKLTLVSHQSKITSRINFLYHLPGNNNMEDFKKYGYITFGDNLQSGLNTKEVKKLSNLNIHTLYLRLIFYKNHPNKHNFFNQVALCQLTVQGTGYDYVLPSMRISQVSSHQRNQFVQAKLSLLGQFKQKFVEQQQFSQAKKIKQIIQIVKRLGNALKKIQDSKMEAIQLQDFQRAKKHKKDTDQLKAQINSIINNFYDPVQKVVKPIKYEQKIRHLIDGFGESRVMYNSLGPSNSQSRVTQKSKGKSHFADNNTIKHQGQDQQENYQEEQQQQENQNGRDFAESRISYQQRVVPALLHKKKKNDLGEQENHQNQFLDSPDKNSLPDEPQQISAMNQANASILSTIYTKQFIKKLHSKHWQFKQQALTQMITQAKSMKGKTSKNQLKSFLFAFNKTIKQNSFALCSLAMQLMAQVTKLSSEDPAQFRTQSHYQLQFAIHQTILKFNENQQKIVTQAQNLFHIMPGSQIFGVNVCYSVIVKPTGQKLSVKQKKARLQCLRFMVDKFGLASSSNHHGVSQGVTEYAVKMAEDANNDVRQKATILLKYIRDRGGKERVSALMQQQSINIKNSIQKQINK